MAERLTEDQEVTGSIPVRGSFSKKRLAESIILEKEKINGNYETDEAGTKFIYMLQHIRNRLEFRPIRRQITQEELIQQWAYFYKVNSPEGDVAYEVMLKAKNFQMDKFI